MEEQLSLIEAVAKEIGREGAGMNKQSGKLSDREIDEFGRQFSKRYIVKKRVNAILCGELMLPYVPLNHLPLHMCFMQIIFIAVAKFMKNETRKEALLAFMAPTCVIGGFFALLLPSIFSTTIPVERCFTSVIGYQFFLYHTMLISLGLIIVRSGRVA